MNRPPLPRNKEAEESVIGGLLLGGRKALIYVSDFLQAEDFYDSILKVIYHAIIKLDLREETIDLLTVANQLIKDGTMGHLAAHGSEAYLAELVNNVATWENIGAHAKLVWEQASVRRVLLAADAIARQGYDSQIEPQEFIERAEQTIYDAANRAHRAAYKSVHQLMRPGLEQIQKRAESGTKITGVPTGYVRLDAITRGLQSGHMVTIAARPRVGKSALALSIARNAGFVHRIPSLFFSLEMTKDELLQRLLAMEACIDFQDVASGSMDRDGWVRLYSSAAQIDTIPIYIDDSSNPSIVEIRAKARRWRADRNIFPKGDEELGLVVVDYMQLVTGVTQKGGNREQEISSISRGLKGLAKDLRVPVIALSQLNRDCEERKDHRGQLQDLRESGSIEQDSDEVIFIYRDEIYNPNSPDAGTAEVNVEKQRGGPGGMARLAFLGKYTRFENLAADHRADASVT